MVKKTKRDYRILPNVIITIIGLFMVVVVVRGWTAPTANPPANNVAVPMNLGATSQTKTGVIGAGGGIVTPQINLGGTVRTTWPSSASVDYISVYNFANKSCSDVCSRVPVIGAGWSCDRWWNMEGWGGGCGEQRNSGYCGCYKVH
ncbi:MAG: hypothetical protein ABII25_02575 [bacterium]